MIYSKAHTTQTITFGTYNTAALIFMAVSNDVAILYIYSTGYLVPIKSSNSISVNLSADYVTITVENNSGGAGYLGVIQSGTSKLNIL